METAKKWYKSKVFWAASGLAITAIVLMVNPELLAHPNLDKALGLVFTALGLWGVRVGNKPIN